MLDALLQAGILTSISIWKLWITEVNSVATLPVSDNLCFTSPYIISIGNAVRISYIMRYLFLDAKIAFSYKSGHTRIYIDIQNKFMGD